MNTPNNYTRLIALINAASFIDPVATIEALQFAIVTDPNSIPLGTFPFDINDAAHFAAVRGTISDLINTGATDAFVHHYLKVTRERRPSAFLGGHEDLLECYDAEAQNEVGYLLQFENRDLQLAFTIHKLVAVIARTSVQSANNGGLAQ